MRNSTIKYLLSLLIPLVFLHSCSKDPTAAPGDEEVTSTIHYTATVRESSGTKATVDESVHYIFEEGDRLFVNYLEGETVKMYGYLTITYGIGTNSGTFEGDLKLLGGFKPSDDILLSATLIGSNDKIHSVQDGKITTTYPGTSTAAFPNEVFTSTLAEAISQSSELTGTSTYGDKFFPLRQQSSFLVFSIVFEDNATPGTLAVTLQNNSIAVRSANVTSVTEDGAVQAKFVAAFPSGTVLSSSQLAVGSFETNITNATLAANTYYTISRSQISSDYFTVQALKDVNITFNYTGNGMQYSTNGTDWTDYNSSSDIPLTQGSRLYFRGKKSGFGGKLLTSTGPYVVFGDIMSLMCDNDWNKKTTVGQTAFYRAFYNDTYLRTVPGKTLKLSATTITGESSYKEMFYGCTGITYSPVKELPALSLPIHCYWSMFEGCTSLTEGPEIKATEMTGNACFQEMFQGCTSLRVAPKLDGITTLMPWCYEYMFYGCTSLQVAPDLPATTLQPRCYESMFYGCTSLRTGPTLNISGVEGESDDGLHCYRMFYGCTSLASVPGQFSDNLQLKKNCFKEMFLGCTGLTEAPNLGTITSVGVSSCEGMFQNCEILLEVNGKLNATVLSNSCYKNMFNNCRKITVVPEIHMTQSGSAAHQSCYSMFQNCIYLTGASGELSVTNAEQSFISMYNGCTRLQSVPKLYISGTGKRCCDNMFTSCISLNKVEGTLSATSLAEKCFYKMFLNCTSLTSFLDNGFGTDISSLATSCCEEMFNNCPSLTTVTGTFNTGTLASYCFKNMFLSCSKLTTAPGLGTVTSVDTESCRSMFLNCSSLTSVSGSLNAATLANNCYREMFRGCTKLTSAPAFGVTITTIDESSCEMMFQDCAALVAVTGTFDVETVPSYAFKNMFYGSSVLTTAPSFGINTTVNYQSCLGMFRNCKLLSTVSISLNASTLAEGCYQQMFDGCSSLTDAPALPATTLATSCYSGMFYGCTSLTESPVLPAATLQNNCYQNMFKGCSNLSAVTCLATNISASNCVSDWVNGVSQTGTFYKAASMESWPQYHGSGIPYSNGHPWVIRNFGMSPEFPTDPPFDPEEDI